MEVCVGVALAVDSDVDVFAGDGDVGVTEKIFNDVDV